jgi:adhesin transport system outer membrane protein
VALRAAQAFLNVMRAQEAYAKTLSYQDKIKDYLARINAMVEGGAADESEAAQAKNIQSMLENTVAEMDGQVKLALADYNEAVGSMPGGELHNDNTQSVLAFKNVDEAVGYASGNHPLILSAQKSLDAEDDEVSADIGSMFPTLDGELSYLKRDQKEEIGGEVEDGRAVMRLNWDFSTGGGQLAKIRQSKAERSEALARIAQTQREIERDVRRSYIEYETAAKQRELAAKRTGVTRDLFHTYEKQFEASKVRLLQLMQAENQLFTSELEQINANYRVTMAEYTALASMGNLVAALHLDGSEVAAAPTLVPEEKNAEVTAQDVYPQAKIETPPIAGK